MDHFDISNTVGNTGALMVMGVATTVMPTCSVFFFNLVRGRPLKKLATKIFDLPFLISGVCLNVYLLLHISRTVVFFYIQGGSNMTGTDLCVNKPHCAAAVRP